MDNILVIEDSKTVQLLLADTLAGKYDLEFRDDGYSGIAAAREKLPDLILLDIHMPKIDGLETCALLKKDPVTSDIPVIFITSLDSEKERVKGFEVGAQDYIVKPFYRDELLARIKVHIAFRKSKMQALELERLAVFREMAVAIAHEINNPLTSIYAFLHVLQRDLADSTETVKRCHEGLKQEVIRIQQITGRLAHATKASTTNYSRNISMIDLENV